MKKITLLTALLPLGMAAAAEPANDYSKPVELISGEILPNFQTKRNWAFVGEVKAVPDQKKLECSGEGTILTNATAKKSRAPYLFIPEI